MDLFWLFLFVVLLFTAVHQPEVFFLLKLMLRDVKVDYRLNSRLWARSCYSFISNG